MKTIYKYVIKCRDSFVQILPQGAKVIAVQTQQGQPVFWATVDTEQPPEPREFFVVGTGHNFDAESKTFLGTFQLEEGTLIFHLFEPTRGIQS